MQEFIAYLIKNLVDRPDDVEIKLFDGEKSTVIEIHAHTSDIAKLVGRQGRTIKALRTIVMTVAARVGRKVRLEIIQ